MKSLRLKSASMVGLGMLLLAILWFAKIRSLLCFNSLQVGKASLSDAEPPYPGCAPGSFSPWLQPLDRDRSRIGLYPRVT